MDNPLSQKDLEGMQTTLRKSLDDTIKPLQDQLTKGIDEVKTLGTIVGTTSESIKTLTEQALGMQKDLLQVQQQLAARPAGGGGASEGKTIGERVIDSAEFKTASERATKGTGKPEMDPVNVGSFFPIKATMVNASGQNQPLVPSERLQMMVAPEDRLLTVRDLLRVATTNSNLIEYAKESVFTNNAGPQYSSPTREGVTKPESTITFELANAAVITLAHWMAASRQVLSDAGMLRGYIDGRLRYGLKLEEEDEILNGDGTAGTLNGLMNQATQYDQTVTADQQLDVLLRAKLQATLSEYVADGFVISHVQWTKMQLLKDTTGRYIFGDPQAAFPRPRAWGMDGVATNSMGTDSFLVGAFGIGAMLFDREQSTIRVSESHDDFFVKNLVAILCEERLALTVFRPAAFIKGTLPS